MERIEHLNKHLNNLTAINNGEYDDDIRNTVHEINKELGIGTENALSSYLTKELHAELNKRTNVFEVEVGVQDEAVISITTGDVERLSYSYQGPARILINQD